MGTTLMRSFRVWKISIWRKPSGASSSCVWMSSLIKSHTMRPWMLFSTQKPIIWPSNMTRAVVSVATSSISTNEPRSRTVSPPRHMPKGWIVGSSARRIINHSQGPIDGCGGLASRRRDHRPNGYGICLDCNAALIDYMIAFGLRCFSYFPNHNQLPANFHRPKSILDSNHILPFVCRYREVFITEISRSTPASSGYG